MTYVPRSPHNSNSPAVTRVAPLMRASRTDLTCACVLHSTGFIEAYVHYMPCASATTKGPTSIPAGALENGDRVRALSHRMRAHTLCQAS